MPRSTKRRPIGEINVVPYIDVMLVLLIIFMITAPLIQQGVEIDLPQAPAEPIEENNLQRIVLTVDEQGRYFLDIGKNTGKPITEEELRKTVSLVLRKKPQTPIMIRGDKDVKYDKVVQAMTALQAAGAPSIGLSTEPSNK